METTDETDVKYSHASQLYNIKRGVGQRVKVGGSFIVKWRDGGSDDYPVLTDGVESMVNLGISKETKYRNPPVRGCGG